MAIGSQKTKVQRGAGTPVAYTELEEVTDVQLSGVNISTIDTTHLQSTAKEFIPGLKDNGTLNITCNYVKGTVQEALWTDANEQATSLYKIALEGVGTTAPIIISFSGFVTKYELSGKVDNKITLQVSLKVTGDITIETE